MSLASFGSALHDLSQQVDQMNSKLVQTDGLMRTVQRDGIATLETLQEVGAAGTAVVQKLYELKREVVETKKVSTESLDAIEKLIEEKMPRARIWLSKLVQDAADGKMGMDELLAKMNEFVLNPGFQQLDVTTGHFYGDLQGFITAFTKLTQQLKDADAAAAGAAGNLNG